MSDLDLQAATGAMHHYVLDNGSPTEFKNMWAEEDLLRAVQKEFPYWYKLHPGPDLTENREVDIMERCKAVEWWRRWVRRLKPAAVEYLNRFLDNHDHQHQCPKLSLLNLVLVICHAITNLCKMHRRWSSPESRELQEFKARLVNKGYSITRSDGYDDLAWLPVMCTILTDYMHEPVLVALALETTGTKRIGKKFMHWRSQWNSKGSNVLGSKTSCYSLSRP